MTKVRNLLLIALVMMPAVTLNASSLTSDARPGLGAPQPVTGSCWFYMNGRWYLLPC